MWSFLRMCSKKMPKMTPKRSHIDKILDLWDKWTAQKHTKTANINVKKLASLQHCVRAMTAAAIFEQLKQQISQNMILRRSTVTFLAMCCTSNIMFCDICCFSCANTAAAVITLTQCCKLASFFTFITLNVARTGRKLNVCKMPHRTIYLYLKLLPIYL